MTRPDIAVVTGGAGFIGSHTVDLLLERGFAVRAIDNLVAGRMSNLSHLANEPRFEFAERDIRELTSCQPLFKDARFVFHFAGIGDIVPSIERPLDYMSTNVLGTIHVLEAARHAGVGKVVYAASSSCYGIADVPTREDHPIAAQYPYALSKLQGEEACFHWSRVYNLPVGSIRIFNAYGPRSRTAGAYGAVFGVFLRQKLAGQPFTVIGDGTQRRDFVYVTDVADAFLRVAEEERSGEVYNIGAGNPQSINRLVELMGGAVEYLPKRPGEPDCTWADITKITTRVGWKPEVSFEAGVERVLDRIEDWRDAPLWDADSIETATRPWFAALSSG